MGRRWPTLCLGLLLGTGCSSAVTPQVRLLGARCVRVQSAGEGEAIAFIAAIEAREAVGRQLIYRVEVFDSRSLPVRSWTDPYQTASGHVGAGKSLMVLTTPWRDDAVTVSIPIAELELRTVDLPAWATIGVYLADGTCAAQERLMLPLSSMPERAVRKRVTGDAAGPEAHEEGPGEGTTRE